MNNDIINYVAMFNKQIFLTKYYVDNTVSLCYSKPLKTKENIEQKFGNSQSQTLCREKDTISVQCIAHTQKVIFSK